jgi:hypothetical protein
MVSLMVSNSFCDLLLLLIYVVQIVLGLGDAMLGRILISQRDGMLQLGLPHERVIGRIVQVAAAPLVL